MAPPIRFGILGAGAVSRQFALSLALLPDAIAVAVASRTRQNAERFARELGLPRAYGEPAALFDDREVDVVYVATPAGVHREHALAAIAAGKAVLIEKPFAASSEEAREIVRAAREARVFCMEAMWMRFVPLFDVMRELVQGGALGEVTLLEAELGFPIPYREGSRYYDAALGGGALLDLGVYPLSLAYALLGPPERALALRSERHGVDTQMCMVLAYPRALAQLTCSFENHARNSAYVLGSGGTLEIEPPLYAPSRLTLTRGPAAARDAEARAVASEVAFRTASAPSGAHAAAAGGAHAAAPSGAHAAARRWLAALDRVPRLVELRRRWTPTLKPLLRRNRERIARHFPGFGYQFEAAEVVRCLRAGELESPRMPLDETVAILELLSRLAASAAAGGASVTVRG